MWLKKGPSGGVLTSLNLFHQSAITFETFQTSDCVLQQWNLHVFLTGTKSVSWNTVVVICGMVQHPVTDL